MTDQTRMIDKEGSEAVYLLSQLLGHHPNTVAVAINDAAKRGERYAERHDPTGSMPPAPMRFVDIGRPALIKTVLGKFYDAYAEALKSDLPPHQSLAVAGGAGQIPADVVRLLYYPDDTTSRGLALSACGFATSNLNEMRFVLRSGVILDVAPALHSLLEQTDISDELPWSQLRLPYPAVYVHLPPLDSAGSLQLPTVEGGNSSEGIDGFYAQEDVDVEGKRMITVMLVRNAEDSVANGSTLMLGVAIDDEDQPILERLEQVLTARNEGYDDVSTQVDTAQSIFKYLTKVMLYMSLPDRDAVFEHERTGAIKKAQAAPAGIMRKKQLQKTEHLYDRIVVGRGVSTEAEADAGKGAGQRAVHWRRGHFRGQRVGAGRMNIKIVWVRPALIGAAHTTEAPARKTYSLES